MKRDFVLLLIMFYYIQISEIQKDLHIQIVIFSQVKYKEIQITFYYMQINELQ